MTTIFIDPIERTKIVTRWVKITLACLHIWASALIIAALFGNNNADLLIAMFSTCTFGIGATLIILLLDRGADVIINRFSTIPIPMTSTETTTKTVQPALPLTEIPGDANINVAGNASINKDTNV